MHRIMIDCVIAGQHIVVSSYYLMEIIAIITGVCIGFYFTRKNGHAFKNFLICIAALLIILPAGCRLVDWINRPDYYSVNGLSILSSKGGMVLYGGLLLALVGCYVVCRIMHIDFWSIMDALTPGLGMAVAIGAVGCFLNGCCFGKPTTVAWSVIFPPDSPASLFYLRSINNAAGGMTLYSLNPISLHPTQVYESVSALAGVILALILLKRTANTGVPFLAFLLVYYILRAFNWYWRAVTTTNPVMLKLWPIIMPAVVIILLALLIWRMGLNHNSPADAGRETN